MSDTLPAQEEDLLNVPAEESLGAILRTARLEKTSSSLDEIASEIRIRPHLLEALENDDYAAFPGFVYAVGFLRAYANYLGLDARDLTERLRKSQFAPRQDSALVFPQPLEDSRMPKRWLAMFASVLCLGVYGVWYGFSAVGEDSLAQVPEVSKTLVQHAPQVSVPVAKTPVTTPQLLEAPAAGVQKLTLPDQPAATAPQINTPAPAIPATPAATLIRHTMDGAAKPDKSLVTLRAKSDAWVRIEGPNAEPILDRVLRAGEAYDAPTGQGLVLITGNAGALDVTVGGRSLGALGPEGAIRRDIALNAQALREYTVVNQ